MYMQILSNNQLYYIVPDGQIDNFVKAYFDLNQDQIYFNQSILQLDHLINVENLDNFSLSYKIYNKLKTNVQYQKYLSVDYINQLLTFLSNIQAQQLEQNMINISDEITKGMLLEINDIKTKYFYLHELVDKHSDFSNYIIVDGYYTYEQKIILDKLFLKHAQKISLFNKQPTYKKHYVCNNYYQQIKQLISNLKDKNNYDNSIIVCYDNNSEKSLIRMLESNNIPIKNKKSWLTTLKTDYINTVLNFYNNFDDNYLIYKLFIKHNILNFNSNTVKKLREYYFKFKTFINFSHLLNIDNIYNLLDSKELEYFRNIEKEYCQQIKDIFDKIEALKELPFPEYLQTFFYQDDKKAIINLITKYYLLKKNNQDNFLDNLLDNELLNINLIVQNSQGITIMNNLSIISNNYDYYFLDMVEEYFNSFNHFTDIFNFKHNFQILSDLKYHDYHDIANYYYQLKKELLSQINFEAYSPKCYLDQVMEPIDLGLVYSMIDNDLVYKDITNRNYTISYETAKNIFVRNAQMSLSPTMLNNYYTNPFRCFLNYGLNISDASDEGYNLAIKGIIMHLILENVTKEYNHQLYEALIAKNIRKYNELLNDCNNYIDEVLSQIINLFKSYYLEKYFDLIHEEFSLYQMTTNIKNLVVNLYNNEVLKYLKNVNTEKAFSYNLEFEENINLVIKGKIDCISSLYDKYLFLFDYKSSNHNFSIGKIQNTIQLPTYLLPYEHKVPYLVGAYYINVNKPNQAFEGINLLSLNAKYHKEHKNKDIYQDIESLNNMIINNNNLIVNQNKKRYYSELNKMIKQLNVECNVIDKQYQIIHNLISYTKHIYKQLATDLLNGNFEIKNDDKYFNYKYLFLDGIEVRDNE